MSNELRVSTANDAFQGSTDPATARALLRSLPVSMLAGIADLNHVEPESDTRSALTRALIADRFAA